LGTTCSGRLPGDLEGSVGSTILDIYHGKGVLVKGHALGYALAVIEVLDTCRRRSLDDMRINRVG